MGKKSRLRKERAEAEKADSSNRIASEGPSSASASASAADADADSSSTRTTIILPFSRSSTSILGPAFSPDSPYPRPEDFFLGLDERGEPRMVVKGSDFYEITKEPASDAYQIVKDPAKSEDIHEASPEPCTRPLNASPPPSPPSTSASGSSSSANKRSKNQAGGSGSAGQ